MYQRLELAHEEQIRKMRLEDKKEPQEIVDFFKTAYKIKLPLWKIGYICKKAKPQGGVATKEKSRRNAAQRKYITKKRLAAAPALDDEGDVDVQELVALLTQIDAGYKKLLAHFKATLKQLRSELVKSRAQVQEMIKGAGIEVPEEESIKVPEV